MTTTGIRRAMGEFSRRPETVYALIWVAVESMCISLLSFQTFYDI